MLQRLSPWLAGLALLLNVPSSGAAQRVESPYRYLEPSQGVGIFFGVHRTPRGRFGLGPGSGVLAGVRYDVEATGPIGVEAVMSYFDASRRVVDPNLPESSWVIGEVPSELFFVDLRVRLSLTGRRTWHNVAPHLLFGVGLGLSAKGADRLDAELAPADRFLFGNKFSPLTGAGVRIRVADSWAIRADGSLTLYRIDTPSGFREPSRGLEGVQEREWIGSPTFSLGLSYLF